MSQDNNNNNSYNSYNDNDRDNNMKQPNTQYSAPTTYNKAIALPKNAQSPIPPCYTKPPTPQMFSFPPAPPAPQVHNQSPGACLGTDEDFFRRAVIEWRLKGAYPSEIKKIIDFFAKRERIRDFFDWFRQILVEEIAKVPGYVLTLYEINPDVCKVVRYPELISLILRSPATIEDVPQLRAKQLFLSQNPESENDRKARMTLLMLTDALLNNLCGTTQDGLNPKCNCQRTSNINMMGFRVPADELSVAIFQQMYCCIHNDLIPGYLYKKCEIDYYPRETNFAAKIGHPFESDTEAEAFQVRLLELSKKLGLEKWILYTKLYGSKYIAERTQQSSVKPGKFAPVSVVTQIKIETTKSVGLRAK